MTVTGLFGRYNLSRLQLQLQLPDEIYAGHPTLIRLRLLNGRRYFPGFLLELRCAGARTVLPLVPAGGSETRSLEVRFDRRGEHPLPEIVLRSIFPVNFFSRGYTVQPAGTALIFPAPQPCALPQAAGGSRASGSDFASTPGEEGELRAINDYRGGEPLKAIHWKHSARQENLKVKQHTSLSEPPLLLELEQLPGSLEAKLSQACYLVLTLARQQRRIGLRLAGQGLPPGSGRQHKLQLLKELARYAAG